MLILLLLFRHLHPKIFIPKPKTHTQNPNNFIPKPKNFLGETSVIIINQIDMGHIFSITKEDWFIHLLLKKNFFQIFEGKKLKNVI
jgi:hypothetical protein